ncbi:MAG: sigma-70 family RNA polymerase sigma factor [Deltaproteobacteria bacterium]|nr:sigma-70 family RNA polymerase sigma factor [Deltaproteobacteria bacterium]
MSFAGQADGAADAFLVRRAQAGDRDAFAALVVRYQGPVFRCCRRHLDAAEAEDAAQETFVRAYVHVQKIDPGRPLLPWLVTIARRLALDRNRKHKPTLDVDAGDKPDPARLEDRLQARTELAIVANGIRTLKPIEQETLLLFHVECLSYADIATVLALPIGTVMTHLHRGRAKLKALVDAPGTKTAVSQGAPR